ncbi:sugar kinase [Rhodothermaceae bacterium RA]|nr:sugar kinase [Rhodothermaceae bacterium RA]
MNHFAVGIDLGGTMMKAALVERGQGLRHHIAIDTHAEKGPDHVIGRIQQAIEMMMKESPNGDIAGVGIGVPGSVDWERSSVHYPANLPGWEVVNLRRTLQERLGRTLPVIVENDANVAGLGSAHYGVGRPHDSFIMITLGTGVGGAIIYRNTIFRGTTGAAGEIGHMSIDYEGPWDRAGVAGSIEAYIGQRFLSRHARYQLLTREPSVIHELAGEELEDLTPKMLYDAAEQGDESAREVLAWAGHKLGVVLGSAINLLDIRKVIVGGGMSAAGDYILEPARRTVRRYVMPALRNDVEILRETLGNAVGMLGAAHLVFEYLDAHGPSSEP